MVWKLDLRKGPSGRGSAFLRRLPICEDRIEMEEPSSIKLAVLYSGTAPISYLGAQEPRPDGTCAGRSPVAVWRLRRTS